MTFPRRWCEGVLNQKEKTKLSALSAEFNTMKAVSKFVVMFSVGMLGSIAALAMTPEQYYIETCSQVPGVPVPISVVTPRVGANFENRQHVRFERVADHEELGGFGALASEDVLVRRGVLLGHDLHFGEILGQA